MLKKITPQSIRVGERSTHARAHDRARPTHADAATMGVNDHDTFSGLTPLHEAAANGDLSKVVEIMDDGADVNIRACGEVRARRREIDSRVGTMVSTCLCARGGDARGGARESAREAMGEKTATR